MRTFLSMLREISIHALREEGDAVQVGSHLGDHDFYPRPPRGGRPDGANGQRGKAEISIHALREEGDLPGRPTAAHRRFISIHALREEGDAAYEAGLDFTGFISIHALREEGDVISWGVNKLLGDFYPRPPRGGRQQKQRQNLYFLINYTTFCTNLEEL